MESSFAIKVMHGIVYKHSFAICPFFPVFVALLPNKWRLLQWYYTKNASSSEDKDLLQKYGMDQICPAFETSPRLIGSNYRRAKFQL